MKRNTLLVLVVVVFLTTFLFQIEINESVEGSKSMDFETDLKNRYPETITPFESSIDDHSIDDPLNDPFKNISYIWVVSMGRSGTKTLSQQGTDSVSMNMETYYQMKELKPHSSCKLAASEASDIYQWSASVMNTYLNHVNHKLQITSKSRYLEAGHTLVCGRHYETLCGLLGDKMGLVYLEHNPLRVAHSFCTLHDMGDWEKVKDPEAYWILSNDEASFLSIPTTVFNQFTCFQRVLWAIDELDQQYRNAVKGGPCLIIAETYWDTDYVSSYKYIQEALQSWLLEDLIPNGKHNSHVDHSVYDDRLELYLEAQQSYLDTMRTYYPDIRVPHNLRE